MFGSSDTTKSSKLENNVFFSHFHPLNDYCVQVHILHTHI